MKKSSLWKSLLALCFSGFGMISCIDNNYDLSDLDTDEITIGDKITAPLGKAVISASVLLNEDELDEIFTDPLTGNYYASYSDRIELKPGQMPMPAFSRVAAKPAAISIGANTGNIPSAITVDMEQVTSDIKIDTEGNGESISKIIFETEENRLTYLNFYITIENIEITPANASTLDLLIEVVPDGYKFIDGLFPSGITLQEENRIKCVLTTVAGTEQTIGLPVESVETTSGDRIAFSGKFTLGGGSHVRTNGEPVVKISTDFSFSDYKVIYGTFNTTFNAPENTISMDGLSDLFEGDGTVLSFINPHIKLQTGSNIGVDLDIEMTLTARNSAGLESFARITGVDVSGPKNYPDYSDGKIWIAAEESNKEPDYTFNRNDQLNNLISISPESLIIETNMQPATGQGTMFIPYTAAAAIEYQVVIPLAPAPEFKAVIHETLEDAFDEDIVEYLFSNGSAEIFGNVVNGIPLDFNLSMVFTDQNGNTIDIALEPQPVKSCASANEPSVSPISFKIGEGDMPKMETARNILLQFDAKGTSSGLGLNPGQEIVLDLQIRKEGGITIKN